MKKRFNQTIHRWAGTLATACLLLSACTEAIDEEALSPVTSTDPDSRIYISGGGNEGVLAETKGYMEPGNTSGPQIEGVCRADKLDVFVFKAGNVGGVNDPDTHDYIFEQKITANPLSILGNDRWCTSSATIQSGYLFTYLYSSALAYNQKEESYFTVQSEGTNRTTLSVSLTDALYTPELFYGIVVVGANDVSGKRENDWFRWHTTYGNEANIQFTGRIYRIVSQLNVKITEIPTEAIEKVELLVSHLPKEITLFGSHGEYYPVTAVTDPVKTVAELTPVASAELTIDGEDEATLSTFLLPSEVGSELSLRVTYRPSTTAEEQAEGASQQKTFPIRPEKSHYLTGTDAGIYSVGAGLEGENGDLYVYDNRNGKYCFYSYSNVRVNVSGKFEDFAAATGEAEVVIEVEPGFEEVHDDFVLE